MTWRSLPGEVSRYYRKPYFRNNSYFICTVSDRTEEMIRHYIRNQGAADSS
ncbi:MAG: transposase [Solobacterium sp.]|nr:transposase [Solobacterium sp.]